jgi:hypothetical protein
MLREISALLGHTALLQYMASLVQQGFVQLEAGGSHCWIHLCCALYAANVVTRRWVSEVFLTPVQNDPGGAAEEVQPGSSVGEPEGPEDTGAAGAGAAAPQLAAALKAAGVVALSPSALRARAAGGGGASGAAGAAPRVPLVRNATSGSLRTMPSSPAAGAGAGAGPFDNDDLVIADRTVHDMVKLTSTCVSHPNSECWKAAEDAWGTHNTLLSLST